MLVQNLPHFPNMSLVPWWFTLTLRRPCVVQHSMVLVPTLGKFARRLSTLSMEWSGNFSKEEYLALAQDIGQEDTPGIVSLESFKGAAEAGSLHLCPEYSPLRSEKGTVVDSAPAAKVPLQDASGLDGGGGGEACHVSSASGLTKGEGRTRGKTSELVRGVSTML